ncbi:RNA polymerase sigma factor [Alicyclobacillus sp. ALC3]|uniref:RNA polymerase sigma factor n=1 Tax=Alicyclobacillus sp. ALC3 TaxID=2796143 RepID=UPI002378C77B|nr:sigma-70 family RNA polymerase sigma factor [Alicyclobacillus sp. ALC3]WDL95893.1 sigma-70 family RNA polymerase sigma factor [Alicyclobacillus sp. ALC3]
MAAVDDIRQLFEEYANDIFRYAKVSLAPSHDPNDAVQEVFYRAFKSWHTFRGESNPRTWLFTIARNYIFDLQRKTRMSTVLISDTDLSSVTDHRATVDGNLLIIWEAVAALKETYRTVVVLRHIEGFTVAETATILGWSETKVTTTDHRALARLKTLLSNNHEGVVCE